MARLLLVEDTPEIWDFLSRRLQRRGHEVALAHDGRAGLEAVRQGRPEVILLDMNLPVMDGWTVARTLKDNPETQGIPIIALTAHALAGDRDKAIAAGCDDYHPKPVDFSKLLTQIDAALGQAA
jgi:CheY-like chemotaxis protein